MVLQVENKVKGTGYDVRNIDIKKATAPTKVRLLF